MNILENILTQHVEGSILGPARYSQGFDPKTNELLDIVEFEVVNGTRVIEPLPFGMFAEVEKLNLNKSNLKIRLVKGFNSGTSAFFALQGSQIDPRYGVMFHYTNQVVPAGTQGTLTTSSGAVIGSEVQPMDPAHSMQISARLNALPANQVSYGKRRENLPDQLLAVVVGGTEQWFATPSWKCAPDGPLKARFTRSFSYGPPADFDQSNAYRPWTSEPVQYYAEYSRTSISDTTSNSTSTSVGTNSGTNNSTSQNTSESTSRTTSDSTSNTDSTSTNNSNNTGTSLSTSTNFSTSESNTNSTGSSSSDTNSRSQNTTTSTNTGYSSSSSQNFGSSQNQSNTNSQNNSNSDGYSFSNSWSIGTGRTNSDSASVDSTATSDSGAPLASASVARSSQSYSNSGSNHQGQTQNTTQSSSSGSGNNSGYSNSAGSSSSTGSSYGTSTNSGTGESTNTGSNFSSGTSTSNGVSFSVSNSTNRSNGSSDSTNTSVSDGVSYTRNLSNGNSTSTGTSRNSGSSTSDGTSNNTSQGTSQSHTVSIGKSVFSLTVPKCLHAALTIPLPDGGVINIPATVPPALPWGGYLEVARNSEHWKNGVWVTETIEVYLPA